MICQWSYMLLWLVTDKHLIELFPASFDGLKVDKKQCPVLTLFLQRKEKKFSDVHLVHLQSFFWSHSEAVGFEDTSWAFRFRSNRFLGHSGNPFAVFQDNQIGNCLCWLCRLLCVLCRCTWNFSGLDHSHSVDYSLVYHSHCTFRKLWFIWVDFFLEQFGHTAYAAVEVNYCSSYI